MTANLHLIQQRCAEIRLILRGLEETGRLSLAEFTSHDLLVDATLYRLQCAIEAAQAICTHLAARIPTRTPRSAPDCFAALAEVGVIPTGLGLRLQQMARFRNLLVHRYWELDLAQVHAILSSDLGDLVAYVEAIEEYLR